MAEVATAPENRAKLTAGSTLVTPEMVAALEAGIDDLLARFDMPSDFTVPGENRVAAALDPGAHHRAPSERFAVAEPVEFVESPYLDAVDLRCGQEGPEHRLAK